MKPILVTGGSAFIGRTIVESLGRSFPILAPTHKELDLLDSVSVGRYIHSQGIDTIIHCASGARFGGVAQSIGMFTSLLEHAGEVERIICFGSGAEYDKRRDLIRVKENEFGLSLPADEYGLGKYLIHLLAGRRTNILTLRLFGVYGPYEDYCNKYISNTIVKQILGMPIVIKQDVVFDYLYIDDLVRIVRHMLTHRMRHRVYNVTPDESIRLSDIVRIIQDIAGDNKSFSVRFPGLNFQYTGDNRRLRRELPGFRFLTYEKGIGKLYRYYQVHRKEIRKDCMRKDTFFARAIVRTK